MADDITFGALTVCMRHYQFVPCRRCDEPTPKFWSTEPADIDLVRRLQQQEEFVTDDIVTRLRDLLDGPVPMTVERQDVREAADEIERLRTALHLAVGELSTHSEHRHMTPDLLVQHFMEEASREQ